MADFCLECWNKINETKESEWRYSFTWRKELCGECRKYKRVIVTERLWPRIQRLIVEAFCNLKKRRRS